ncbi:MAG: chorismate-binding protein [Bacteroides sp.]|nr:chorismate-binding protein [Prevotella sp.]MCM1407216.1 chorismate-binding protein [Treponema brennaborense]MCM1470368.1 chorismate-binding protein [Bacteroides sp.]
MLTETIRGEHFTPFSLAKKFNAKAVLESASFSHGKNRYSILMIDEAFRVFQDDSGVSFSVDGTRFPAGGNLDILDVLSQIAAENSDAAALCGFPVPMAGIGYLSYEFCRRCDTITLAPQTDELGIPESLFILGHTYLVFDHFSETITICAMNYQKHAVDLRACLDTVKKRLADLDFTYLSEPPQHVPCDVITDEAASKREYVEKVEQLKKHIVAGNIIQAVPSRRLRLKSELPALEAYRRLRALNPSPYLFYLDFGDFQLTGASPESLVRVRDGKAVIHPIAGTRRRGKNEAEDAQLEAELLQNAKERAEHLMLVDLARNDLGRVCAVGSVNVDSFMSCERFSHVMHLVSEVSGVPASGKKAADVLRAAFPAGTVSGAPKISAIEILSGLEKTKRGFYAGAVGYIGANDCLDFCIAIRCALRQNDMWTLQAGGGIVNDSSAEREYEETAEKLAAMRYVIEGDA